MKNKFRLTYLFYIIAIVLFFISFSVYKLFQETSDNIKDINLTSQINYINNISVNLENKIKSHIDIDISKNLTINTELRNKLDSALKLFITNRYRYIYLLDKEQSNSKEFRFLLDGEPNIDEKSEFLEPYIPLNVNIWNDIYKTKKAIYFTHKEHQSVWMTYLYPIVIDNKVEAIIAIDFSLKEHDMIVESFYKLDEAFMLALIFSMVIFIVIIIFAYLDQKREEYKIQLFDKLKKNNKQLEEQSSSIEELNKTLEIRIKEEVEKNRERDKALLHQSRLAQMGEMISMIAHQWRQPLAAISSTSIALHTKAQLNNLDKDMTMEFASKISDYSQHLSSTIDDFRYFFKANKEKTKTTYNNMIKSTLMIVEVSLKNKHIELIINLDCDKIIETYENEVKQVLLNLIKNAEDIIMEREKDNATITISSVDGCLIIGDNAGGVPEEIIDKIFDPYFSTKLQKDGTGLGLYMSKTIIEEHCGGKLSVSNDKDGAVFTIKLDNDV